MEPDHQILSPEEWERAHQVVSAWKNDSAAELMCPRCSQPGLTVLDQSSRPYVEWYELSCGHCGLKVALHVPQAPPIHTPI